jgi:hypothetical protein
MLFEAGSFSRKKLASWFIFGEGNFARNYPKYQSTSFWFFTGDTDIISLKITRIRQCFHNGALESNKEYEFFSKTSIFVFDSVINVGVAFKEAILLIIRSLS